MVIPRPLPGECAKAFPPYLDAAPKGDVLELLQAQMGEVTFLYAGLSEAQGAYRYAPDKWSLKDLVQHLTDTERIFAYRCLRIGRGDTTSLPGFEEDAYAAAAQAGERLIASLLADFRAVRTASLTLFRSLPEEAWGHSGTVNRRAITARCFPFLCYGHAAHHLKVIQERYQAGLAGLK